jgi:uncharacterized membrane protein
VLVLMMFAGAAIRQFFVLRHGFKLGRNKNPWPYAAAGAAGILAVIVWLKPVTPPVAMNSGAAPALSTAQKPDLTYKALEPVLAQRCYQCHGEAVQMKNVRLDSPQSVASHAQAIYQQVVVSKIMPMNNATGITDAERALVKQWFEAGAAVQ